MPAVQPEWISIPTRDRPECLRASLRAQLTAARLYGHRTPFLIFDNSRTIACAEANRATVVELSREFGIPVHHIGQGERLAWAAALAHEAHLPPALVEFAILPRAQESFTTGASLNCFLLHLAGTAGLSFDDDVFPELSTLPDATCAWHFSSRFDPTEFRFAQPAHDITRVVQPTTGDLHSLLAQPLGQTQHELLGDGSPAPVLFTACGVLGDSGMGNPAYLLKLPGASRASLIDGGESTFTHALRSRQMARATAAPIMHECGHMLGHAFGIDHRRCLAPALPYFRAHETLLSLTIRDCWFQPRTVHLPFLVHHRPPVSREEDLATFTTAAAQTAFSHWYVTALQVAAPLLSRVSDPNQRLVLLGQTFRALGELPLPEATALFAQGIRRSREQELAALESLLHEHQHSPAYWARCVHSYASAIREHLASPSFPAPLWQFRSANSPDQAIEQALALLRDFGLLLEHWPTLFIAAQRLRSQGLTLLSLP